VIGVTDPATGAVLAELPVATPEDVARLVDAGRTAQPAWEGVGVRARAAWLRRLRRTLLAADAELIATITAETGKTYEDALLTEVAHVVRACGFWARQGPGYLADERVSGRLARRRLVVRRRPRGVVGVITPWNYPLVTGLGEALPALLAGNAVVVKPSPLAPLTSLLAGQLLQESGLPDGLFGVAVGETAAGEALVDLADFVAFTGSTATGRVVGERAARALTPASLELGGKDALIVLADADLERAANAAVYYSTFNAGQACTAVERVYVEEAVHDAFVALVAERMRALRPARGGARAGAAEVGAVRGGERVDAQVRDALERGALRLVGCDGGTGGGSEPATLLVGVDHSMAVMREETFGPVLPVMPVSDAVEAIALANDSPYGLQASVFSGDRRRAEAVADRLECGVVAINDAVRNYSALALPMGGWKASGIGTRHGAEGIRRYCRQQSRFVSRFAGAREPHFFPNRTRRTELLRRALRLAR